MEYIKLNASKAIKWKTPFGGAEKNLLRALAMMYTSLVAESKLISIDFDLVRECPALHICFEHAMTMFDADEFKEVQFVSSGLIPEGYREVEAYYEGIRYYCLLTPNEYAEWKERLGKEKF